MTFADKLYVVMGFATIVIGAVAISMFWDPTYDALTDLGSPSLNASLVKVNPSDTDGWMDWMIVFAYFGLNILTCIILPLYVENNPVYIAGLLLASFIYAYVLMILSNVLSEWLTSVSSPLVYTQMIVDHLVEIEIIFVLLLAIVMYYKRQTEAQVSYYQ